MASSWLSVKPSFAVSQNGIPVSRFGLDSKLFDQKADEFFLLQRALSERERATGQPSWFHN
jgi:hypothetical protein